MKKQNKLYLIGIIIIVIISAILLYFIVSKYRNTHVNEYSRNYFYMDTYINVKVYTNSEDEANKALDGVDDIYKTYHNLTDRYTSYDNGLYNLNHGSTEIDSKLYEMIKYADGWYDKTNGLLDISIGNVVDIWKKYREAGTGVPTLNELKSVNINHNDIKITDNNVVLTNKVEIDLGAISKGYTTGLVGDYLRENGINKFIINAGGNVLVGDYYKTGEYKIGIEDPTDTSSIYQIIKASNVAVVTSGGYQRNYTYNGVTYNHIINPNTLFPADNMKSVTVIDKSSAEADALSTTLFLMTVDEGKEFIKDYDAEVIWYQNDGTTTSTPGFSQYE